MRDILGLRPTTGSGADAGDNYENNYAMFDISNNDDHKMIGGGNVPRDNYLRNDFLSINRIKFDVCTKEIFHNNDYVKLMVNYQIIKIIKSILSIMKVNIDCS